LGRREGKDTKIKGVTTVVPVHVFPGDEDSTYPELGAAAVAKPNPPSLINPSMDDFN